MISDELLEIFNYLKEVYVPKDKKSEEFFRSKLQDEVNKQYSNPSQVSFELITDLLIGYTLSKMIASTNYFDIIHFEYYFGYSFMRYNSGKKDMESKFTILSDKLFNFGISKFIIDYRSFSESSIRKFSTNLEAIYDVGFKLENVDKGYCLFKKEID